MYLCLTIHSVTGFWNAFEVAAQIREQLVLPWCS